MNKPENKQRERLVSIDRLLEQVCVSGGSVMLLAQARSLLKQLFDETKGDEKENG